MSDSKTDSVPRCLAIQAAIMLADAIAMTTRSMPRPPAAPFSRACGGWRFGWLVADGTAAFSFVRDQVTPRFETGESRIAYGTA